MEPLVCPRREEVSAALSRYPDEDKWELRADVHHCSFCGSINPEDLLAMMHNGCTLGPTDKSYKVYVSTANHSHLKFYFQHFNAEQQIRFIALLNNKPRTFTIEYPGYFYRLPFFIRKEVAND